MSSFQEKLTAATRKNESLVCVGLDPDPALMPIDGVLEFNKAIIDATADQVCCYKPNMSPSTKPWAIPMAWRPFSAPWST